MNFKRLILMNVFRSNEWMTTVVGIITKSLNVESVNDDVRKAALDQLSWELSYATHLGTVWTK